jgi:uncharacterized Zn-binding protein involved in type VI secretion
MAGNKPAARLGDMHTCPMVTGLVPHVGGPISGPGSPTVLIGGIPAARVGDMAVCVGPPDVIAQGAPTVLIGAMPAARMGDMTAHGGMIVIGCPTVLIGNNGGGSPSAGSYNGALTLQQAQAWFDQFKADTSIPWDYPNDCCYTRAEVMAQQLRAANIPVKKVWNYAPSRNNPLTVMTKNDPSGQVNWIYHVAPTIPVRGADGSNHEMVIDPSISDHPMPPQDWKDLQNQPESVLTLTDPNIYYRDVSGKISLPPPSPDEISARLIEHRASRASIWSRK